VSPGPFLTAWRDEVDAAMGGEVIITRPVYFPYKITTEIYRVVHE
jgi:hypothetical protein